MEDLEDNHQLKEYILKHHKTWHAWLLNHHLTPVQDTLVHHGNIAWTAVLPVDLYGLYGLRFGLWDQS